MSTKCVRCSAPTDATVCRPDAHSLAERLTAAAGHAEDANTVIARQARYGGDSRGGTHDSTPTNFKASADFRTASDRIGLWAQRLLDSGAPEPTAWRPTTGPQCAPRRPADGPPAPGKPWLLCEHTSCATIRQPRPSATAETCLWLADHIDQLRKHPDAAPAFRELSTACHQLERLVDRPATGHRLVGMCDCGQILYAPADRPVVQCKGRPRSCGATWHVERSQQILRDHLDQQLMSASEAARLAVHLDGGDRSTEQVRKLINAWSTRSLIVARGLIEGEPTFRFGDIADRLARTPRRNREGAAA